MKIFMIVAVSWTILSLVFTFVVWPKLFITAQNPDTFIKSKCRKCGHIQRCCAPPCARCHSIDMEMIK